MNMLITDVKNEVDVAGSGFWGDCIEAGADSGCAAAASTSSADSAPIGTCIKNPSTP